MSTPFVPDASVTVAWVHPVQGDAMTDALLTRIEEGAEIVVPTLWFVEVANVLLGLERRRRLAGRERREALERLTALRPVLDLDGARSAFGTTSELAAKHGLTVYDATYLELAQRRRFALATRDRPLRTAARRCHVEVLP